MDNVIIQFNETGLESILEKLVSIGGASEKEVEAFNKANASRKQSIDSATGSMDKLRQSVINVEKTIVSGATNEAIKGTTALIDNQIQKQFKLSEAQKKFFDEQKKAADDARKNPPTPLPPPPPTEPIKIYAESLKGLKKQYQDLVAEAIKAGAFTPLGKDFLEQAGKVKLEIEEIKKSIAAYGSQTSTFNSIAEGLRGVGAGFEVAQGAQALFGAGNKNLEEQLVKVQGTMALVNGLTEIQRALAKDSAAVLGIQNVLKKIGITLQTEENVAEGTGVVTKTRAITVQAIENGLTSTSIVVRTAATAAQWLLNNAMLAFPLLAIIGGLTAIAGLFGAFSDSSKEATQSQIDLTKAELDDLEVLKATQDYLNSISKSRQEQIQRDIDLLKVKNGSTEDIRKKEADLVAEQLTNAKINFNLHYDEIQALKLNQNEVVGLTAKLAALNKAKQEGDSKEFDKEIEATTSKLELMGKQVKNAETAVKDLKDANAKAQESGINQKKDTSNEELANAKSVIDAKLRFAKDGTEQELGLKMALAKNEYDTAILNAKATNLSTADIQAKYYDDLRQLNIAFNNKKLQDDIAMNNAILVSVKKGSDEELQLKIKNLHDQNIIDESNTKLSAEAKKAIHQKYINEVSLLNREFAQKQKQDEINTQITVVNAKLAASQKGGEEEMNLQIKKLALEEQLQLASISKDIEGTALGEAKKMEIYTAYLDKIDAIEQAARQRKITEQGKADKELLDYQQKINDLEIANVQTSIVKKQLLELNAFDIKAKQLTQSYNEQKAIIEVSNKDAATKQKELDDLKTKYDDEYRLNKIAKDNEVAKQEKELIKQQTQAVGDYANQTLDILSKANDAYLAKQIEGYNSELAVNQYNLDHKIINQKQYEARKKEIETKINKEKSAAAERAKEVALAMIVIKTAQAVVNALAEDNYSGAIIAGVMGAAEFAIASAQPVPQYYKGTDNAPPGWAWVGEKGPELIYMNGGEKVKTHEKSVEMARESFPALMNSTYSAIDRMPMLNPSATNAMALMGIHPQLDYGLLSSMIGKELKDGLKEMPITMMSFDKNGFSASVREGNQITNYIDSRYSN